jgi:hypothetical protein
VIRFTCWFSRKFFDIHDYKRLMSRTPSHFYWTYALLTDRQRCHQYDEYFCPNCGKRFGI